MKDYEDNFRALETEHKVLMIAAQEISTKLDFIITLLTGTEYPPTIPKQNKGGSQV